MSRRYQRRGWKSHRFSWAGIIQWTKELYDAYIQSEYWKAFIERIVLWRGHECERCGDRECQLEGHHLTYERLGRELPEDIQLVCHPCHMALHGYGGDQMQMEV